MYFFFWLFKVILNIGKFAFLIPQAPVVIFTKFLLVISMLYQSEVMRIKDRISQDEFS